ncbi:TlpA family protein disulfide reductase [Mucilaginibacter mali]|uniref:TlpA family protein disulfide reductase n=1 Tax=Mucilaginibacter mali TaxID=2740462 RepID=A0A7D4QIG3_9SPHI|nr:TlpA disulfide reductase family protein [Mucilaginibacter mali]QKJ29090.1 TlpA family protein disulfide reductase [Mucilaginibacter mali]
MKNTTISLSSYKIILIPVVFLLELSLFFVAVKYFGQQTGVLVASLSIPPIMFFVTKQFFPEVVAPRWLALTFWGFILELSTYPFRGYFGGMQASTLCGFAICLIATFLLIRKDRENTEPWLIALYILIGVSVIQLPVRIYDFTGTLISLPDYLAHVLGVVVGLLLYHRHKIVQTINLSISILLVLFVYFYGYSMWETKLAYGTFTGKVYKKIPVDLRLTDINNTAVTAKKGKLTIMDLWFVRCGACFEAFPEFQKYYNQHKNNPNLQFYTVNQPSSGENVSESFKMLKQRGYTFPMATAGYDNTMVRSLGIRAFPTTIVIDQQGFVVYEGDTKGAMATVNNLLQGGISMAE